MTTHAARRSQASDIAVVALFSLALLAALQFLTPYLLEPDDYFHIKAAWLMRTRGLFHGFPWATQSLWRDHFSDTCFLFHVYLMPFTFMSNLITGAKIATVLLGAACLTSFYCVLWLNGVRAPAFWFALLCSAGPLVLFRLSSPRPQILSVMLMLWCVHFMLNGRRRALGALSFFYGLSYASAFLPFAVAVLYSADLLIREGERDWKTPLAAFTGFAASMLFNPYFPNDLLFLYVQNIYTLKMSLLAGDTLNMGNELIPLDTREILILHWPIAAALLATAYFGLARGVKAGRKTMTMLVLAVAMVTMTFIWPKFVEYAAPFTIFYCALRADELLKLTYPANLRRGVVVAGMLCLVGAFCSTLFLARRDFLWAPKGVYKGAALYLKQNAPAGATVFTCSWDDTPELFFYDDEHRYLVIMDTIWMYYQSPEVWRTWSDAANGRLGAGTRHAITDVLGARYGVCRAQWSGLRKIIDADKSAKVVYNDGETWVFRY